MQIFIYKAQLECQTPLNNNVLRELRGSSGILTIFQQIWTRIFKDATNITKRLDIMIYLKQAVPLAH